MGTLYVTGAPPGDLEDMTFRARRVVRGARLLVASDLVRARQWLNRWGVTTPMLSATQAGQLLPALDAGDAVLLLEQERPDPPAWVHRLIALALEHGHAVAPVPGPSLPITALVISGLPSESFCYLGVLPESSAARREWLVAIAAERRTLVALSQGEDLPGVLAEMGAALGDRPAVLVAAAEAGVGMVWRGTLAGAQEALPQPPSPGRWAVVIGGARDQPEQWDQDRLRAEVRARLALGFAAKEIGRELAAVSGWPRREIYRMAVGLARSSAE